MSYAAKFGKQCVSIQKGEKIWHCVAFLVYRIC